MERLAIRTAQVPGVAVPVALVAMGSWCVVIGTALGIDGDDDWTGYIAVWGAALFLVPAGFVLAGVLMLRRRADGRLLAVCLSLAAAAQVFAAELVDGGSLESVLIALAAVTFVGAFLAGALRRAA